MNIPEPTDLRDIAAGLAESAPQGWVKIAVVVSAVASLIQSRPTVTLDDGSVDGSLRIGAATRLSFGDLRASMYKEGAGTWYNATFTLTADGQLESDFDYDNPPFDGDYDAELLEDDQDRYPRSQENLPPWHPSRT